MGDIGILAMIREFRADMAGGLHGRKWMKPIRAMAPGDFCDLVSQVSCLMVLPDKTFKGKERK